MDREVGEYHFDIVCHISGYEDSEGYKSQVLSMLETIM